MEQTKEPEIYKIERYEHLKRKSKWQPIPIIINGVFPESIRFQTTINSPELAKEINDEEHPYLNINLNDVLGY